MSAISGRACARAVRHALVLACLLPATAGAAAPADFYGVNSGGTLVNNAALRAPALQAMGAGGLSYVRVDASWNYFEPAAPVAGVHRYRWSTYDLFVADLARNGLRWYPMIGYSAPWATSVVGDLSSSPANDADYASFAAALAGRYGSGGSFWAEHPELAPYAITTYGIWNEPSYDHFWHGPEATPARYMTLYLAARAAIKAVDPGARVAAGELLDSGGIDGGAYLRAMLDSVPGARTQIDALAWHPYVGDVDQVLASVANARAILNQYGLSGVPIEITEAGLHAGYAPAQRAQWLHDLAMKLPNAGLNVTRFMPFVWTGDPTWQMTDPDGSPGLLGGAYFQGIRDAATFQPPAPAPSAKRRAAKAKAKAKPAAATTCKPVKKRKAAKATKRPAKCARKISKKARGAKARAKARAKGTRTRNARARRA
jgi:hypothetical protein